MYKYNNFFFNKKRKEGKGKPLPPSEAYCLDFRREIYHIPARFSDRQLYYI